MRRRARSFSPKGLLLIEAVLASIAIGVGLVFISRAMAGQLKALERVAGSDELLQLARAKLQDLEASLPAYPDPIPPADREGAFTEPFDAYEWEIVAAPLEASPGLSRITVTVRHSEDAGRAASLWAVWPTTWVSDGWR